MTAQLPGHGRITDVTGVSVGHVTARRRGWRTGTTVVLVAERPGEGATAGVDVRGGAPGMARPTCCAPATWCSTCTPSASPAAAPTAWQRPTV
ncbi:MAG: P1 family peptidase [Ilumatobacteraceae bacterium]